MTRTPDRPQAKDCPDGQFLCETEKKCMDNRVLCDTVIDCQGGFDEENKQCCEYRRLRSV